MKDALTELRQVLQIVDGHLKFAETKNAVLLAANGATVAAFAPLLVGSGLPLPFRLWGYCIVVGSFVSGGIAIVSFVPLRHRPYLWRSARASTNDNLIFFGEIQKHSEPSYFDAFLMAHGESKRPASEFERMVVNQIIVNARLADRKFSMFETAAWVTLVALLTPIVAGMIAFFEIRSTQGAQQD